MKIIVSEPTPVYQTNKWKVNLLVDTNVFVVKKEVDSVIIQQPFLIVSSMQYAKTSKFKMSSIRGKMSKKGVEVMRKQINKLREEWDRGF